MQVAFWYLASGSCALSTQRTEQVRSSDRTNKECLCAQYTKCLRERSLCFTNYSALLLDQTVS